MTDYAGDIFPKEAWKILSNEPDSTLVDVRTDAEWNYVGVPDVSSLGKKTVMVDWQTYPELGLNPDFVEQVVAQVPNKEAAALFICRSGQRSASAAGAMTEAGYGRCYNVAEGFEGDADELRHRGKTGGWKVAKLPWVQN